MLLAELEQKVLVERQVCTALIAAGAKDVSLPRADEARESMNAWLAPPSEDDRSVLLRALGVRA